MATGRWPRAHRLGILHRNLLQYAVPGSEHKRTRQSPSLVAFLVLYLAKADLRFSHAVAAMSILAASQAVASRLLFTTIGRATHAIRSLSMLKPPLTFRREPPKPGHMPRAEPIAVEHIGKTFMVHSGKEYKKVKVTPQMVAHKFGEFVATRKRKPPPKQKQQKKKR